MKVKNIMFFGAAAVILSAAGAMAAPNYTTVTNADLEAGRKIVASKSYVDAQGNKLEADIAAVSTTVSELPAAGEGVLTIQKNGTDVDTFSANATTNKSINITVPTAVSQLSDAADYATVSYVDTQDALDEKITNKLQQGESATSTITSSSTDTQYPSAKNVYKLVDEKVSAVPAAQTGTLTVAGKGSGATQTFSANQTTGDALTVTLRDLPVKPSSCNATDPCTLLQTATGYGWFHMVTDQSGSATTASTVAVDGSIVTE